MRQKSKGISKDPIYWAWVSDLIPASVFSQALQLVLVPGHRGWGCYPYFPSLSTVCIVWSKDMIPAGSREGLSSYSDGVACVCLVMVEWRSQVEVPSLLSHTCQVPLPCCITLERWCLRGPRPQQCHFDWWKLQKSPSLSSLIGRR